jgi:hypothetical protein
MAREEITIDVSPFRVKDGIYDLTDVFQGPDSDVDYRDMELNVPIWSMGRSRTTGKIWGSTSTFFYMRDDEFEFECVWLR